MRIRYKTTPFLLIFVQMILDLEGNEDLKFTALRFLLCNLAERNRNLLSIEMVQVL